MDMVLICLLASCVSDLAASDRPADYQFAQVIDIAAQHIAFNCDHALLNSYRLQP